MSGKHRIALIHALQDSQRPTWAAFQAGWPEADIFNLMDDSLPRDLQVDGMDPLVDRFLNLGNYAANMKVGGHKTDAILFSCSAFGPALKAVQKSLSIPVLRPNEAAFEEALESGKRIGLMVTFGPALPPLKAELEEMAKERGGSRRSSQALQKVRWRPFRPVVPANTTRSRPKPQAIFLRSTCWCLASFPWRVLCRLSRRGGTSVSLQRPIARCANSARYSKHRLNKTNTDSSTTSCSSQEDGRTF